MAFEIKLLTLCRLLTVRCDEYVYFEMESGYFELWDGEFSDGFSFPQEENLGGC